MIEEHYHETQQPQARSSNDNDYSVEQLLFMLKNKTGLTNSSEETTYNVNAISVEADIPSPVTIEKHKETPRISIGCWENEGHKQRQCHTTPKTLSSILSIAMLMAIASSTATASPPKGPMLCQKQKQGTIWRVPDFKCNIKQLKHDAIPAPTAINLYLPNAVEHQTSATVCQKNRKHVKIYATLMGYSLPQKVESTSLPLTVEECIQMHEQRACNLGVLVNESGLLHTNRELNIEGGWPFVDALRTRTSTAENCYMFQTTIFTRFNTNELHTSLEGTLHCTYNKGNCTLEDGSIMIWTPSIEQKCKYSFSESLEGEYTEEIWMGNQLALTFPNMTQTSDCGRQLTVSIEGPAVEFKPPTKRSKRNIEGLVSGSQLAAQLTFLELDISSSLSIVMNRLISATCSHLKTLQTYVRTAILSTPTELARVTLNNSFLVAERLTDSTIKIWPCIPLEPGSYHFKPTLSEHCFKLIPIFGNRTMRRSTIRHH
jgi:hypothetical protein